MSARDLRAVRGAFARFGLALALASGLPACSVDPEANPAYGCEGCAGACVMGFCLQLQDGGGAGTGALDGGTDAGGGPIEPPPPQACDEPGASEFCYDGPGETATVGGCKAGMRVCGQGFWGSCLGQVLPEEEHCNQQDDDCDGELDEDVELGTCSTGQPGVCDVGMLQCESGIAVCARSSDPGPEQCNGLDDDCDGEEDEDVSSVCYPSAPDGCADDGAGGFTCMGMCVPGVSACVDGVAQPCEGAIEPATEQCGSAGPAQDEDCDGEADNGCTCSANQSQECYSGPIEHVGVGICAAGTQQCDADTNTWGDCTGEVLQGTEDCANEGSDDDCNDVDDDIAGRGQPCTIEDAMGVCRDGWYDCAGVSAGRALTCVGPSATDETCNDLDDDCDGKTDEGLLADVANCGECGHECNDDEECCRGECVNVQDDELNCGRCENDCGNGLECCAGDCVDLLRDESNCGKCGETCTLGCCSGTCNTVGDPICL